MSKQQVTYSELILQKSSQQQQGRPKKPKNKDASSEGQVIYTQLKNSKLPQQQQHRRAQEIPDRGQEQLVIYAELKNSQPSQQQQHRKSKGTKSAGAGSEQRLTNIEMTLPSPFQQPEKREAGQTPDSPSPPWRLVTGILGILCLGLLVAMVSMTVGFIETRYSQGDNSTTASDHNVTPLKGCHSGPCLENWVAYRNHCYLFSKESASWEESRIACAAKNSSLLQIDSKEELDFLKLLSLYHWMGLSFPENAKSWQWTDGSPLSSDLFKVTQSNTRWTCVPYGSHSGNSEFAKNCSVDERYICESSSR
ncbi:natural killer cells antigen CD94-like [Tachyglossus aculeatus]|uniref:natural killer cells antigen CD94-like n=1 Tax=Tachyglossus aculeatus TaxID=9261 RepID=UPI0018F67592|nr:natural killer cells antigen CD94-like [Tachyglossus aculeatus]